jgi:hypothetical protein
MLNGTSGDNSETRGASAVMPVTKMPKTLSLSVMPHVKRWLASRNFRPSVLNDDHLPQMATQGLNRFYVSGDRQ